MPGGIVPGKRKATEGALKGAISRSIDWDSIPRANVLRDADVRSYFLLELNPKGKQRAAPTVSVTVEDDDDAVPAEQPEDYEAPFAPGNDADYFVDEDEEGRFFGGGLSNTQKEILDIFEGQEQEGQDGSNGNDPTVGQALTVQGVRRQLLNLERSINKNSEMRVKWSGNPEK